jgi:D-3-phosphoglycerate dehydrogenase
VISKWGTGIDSIDRAAAVAHGVTVCNTPGAFTNPVADRHALRMLESLNHNHAPRASELLLTRARCAMLACCARSSMAYVLAFARGVCSMDAAIKSGQWEKLPGVCLAESSIGIIGLGAVGRAVAHRAAAFGAAVLAVDPIAPPQAWADAHPEVRLTTLPDVLQTAHILVLCCDLNPGAPAPPRARCGCWLCARRLMMRNAARRLSPHHRRGGAGGHAPGRHPGELRARAAG